MKNIIFDIGNVLTDFRWREFLLEQGFSEEMMDRIAKASVLHPVWSELDRGVWTDEQILQGFVNNDPAIEKEIRSAFANMKGMVTIRDYAIPWIQELKAKGYQVYFLSNFSRKVEVECADCLAFLPYMDGGVFSYRVNLIKPDLTIYRRILSDYGLNPKESVFIDDTMVNIEAAKALEIHGIHFETYEQVRRELRDLGVE